MLYTIYKVTNNLNGKIYIGKHQTANPTDGYYGSGKAIKSALKKHGKENFTKEVLYIFETEAEMNAKEKELITEEFVLREDNYNLGVGGEGGPHFKGKRHSPESRKKMATFGTVLTEKGRNKIAESNKNRHISDKARQNMSEKAKGRRHSPETKMKIAAATRRRHEERRLLREEQDG